MRDAVSLRMTQYGYKLMSEEHGPNELVRNACRAETDTRAMPSVLIVDDEPNIRRMVGALLAAEGYEVRDAADGASGLARAIEAEPDVVLLDLMMPGELDGLATLARVREENAFGTQRLLEEVEGAKLRCLHRIAQSGAPAHHHDWNVR